MVPLRGTFVTVCPIKQLVQFVKIDWYVRCLSILTISQSRITNILMNISRAMDAYVSVTNDVSLAVKSILRVKKAFRTQMQCVEDLTKGNTSLQHKIRELERKNEDLKNKIIKLESENAKQRQIVSDFFCGSNGIDLSSHEFTIGNTIDNTVPKQGLVHPPLACTNRDTSGVTPHPKHRDHQLFPSSPTPSNSHVYKRKATPKKKTIPRKSRRILNRQEKDQSISE